MRLNFTNNRQVLQHMHSKVDELMNAAADTAFSIGQKVIAKAREDANYTNWTNNLRSSYGVAVALNGGIIKHDFELRGDGTVNDGHEGFRRAQELTEQLAKAHPNKLVLIMVAAEYYAAAVESKGGYTVLSMQGIELETILKKYFKTQ